MKHIMILFALLIWDTALFALLLTKALLSALDPPSLPPVTHPFLPSLQIENRNMNSHSFLLRKTFYLPNRYMNGTICINAHDAFTLYLNGNKVAVSPSLNVIREYNPSASPIPEQASWHLAFQLNFSRGGEYIYIYDISTLLEKGKNVFAIQLKSFDPPATLGIECILRPENGEPIKLYADKSWKTNILPLKHWEQQWYMTDYDDSGWQEATTRPYQAVNGPPISYIADTVFKQPFTSPFITAPESCTGEFLFFREIDLPPDTLDLWIRITSASTLYLFLNGIHFEQMVPDSRVINIYDLVQYIRPGKKNEIAIRVVPLNHNSPASFAMDGAVITRHNPPFFFNTQNQWKVIPPVLKKWNTPQPDAQNAVISQPFPFYNNSLYTKEYKGVIKNRGISLREFYFFMTVFLVILTVHIGGVTIIKKRVGHLPLKSALHLVFSHIPAGFILIMMFVVESKLYLRSTWIVLKSPIVWQIATAAVIMGTAILYWRTIAVVSGRDGIK